NRPAWIERLVHHFPPGQFARYLVVGAGNTLFGYGSFALFTALLSSVPLGYVLAAALASLLNISVAFVGYKWFVFKTKGHYLREWLRCVAVYGTGIVPGMVGLTVLVPALKALTGWPRAAPYIGGAIMTALGVVYSFLGNRKFAFHRSPP